MKSSNIGGQAVLEGIMMRNGGKYSVAVRRSNGEIVVDVQDYRSVIPWETPLKIPFIRGIFNFVDSLVLGMKTLTYSAGFFEEEEEEILTEEEAAKREKTEKLFMNLTVAAAVVIAAAIFMVLPYFLQLQGVEMCQAVSDLCSFLMSLPLTIPVLKSLRTDRQPIQEMNS